VCLIHGAWDMVLRRVRVCTGAHGACGSVETVGQLANGADQHVRAIINNGRLQHSNLCC